MTTKKESSGKSPYPGDSSTCSERTQETETIPWKDASELFNFACILEGDVTHLGKIKGYIIREYIGKGLIKLSKQIYNRNELYIITDDEWKEYQMLKRGKEQGLIGYGVLTIEKKDTS